MAAHAPGKGDSRSRSESVAARVIAREEQQ